MKNLIYCEKYKINVNPEWDGNCPSCIFYHPEKENKCTYGEWNPGLKKEKDRNE
jgi:hypothetical protein